MIDRLEMFIALAQARHFGRAAESVGVAQPTLSAAIRQLEESLGVMLVRRGSRYEGLTPEGERVLVWARRIVADSRAMREKVRAARSGLSGTLRLAVIPTALSPASRLTAAFAQAHPEVRLTVLSSTSIAILEDLDGLRIDAGISYLDNEPLGTKTTVPLYEERYALVVRDDHLLAGRDRLAWPELSGVQLCLLTPDMQNRRIIGGLLGQAGVRRRAPDRDQLHHRPSWPTSSRAAGPPSCPWAPPRSSSSTAPCARSPSTIPTRATAWPDRPRPRAADPLVAALLAEAKRQA
jgi:DNA-binding transcriptional LysR family regulator